ncbi:hypothetical protein CEF21_16455 [Bacillus sp. FJAT-42376]|nr:hypothetical protein CEF21_16455 [Bacillus sp. FJAT-42376]
MNKDGRLHSGTKNEQDETDSLNFIVLVTKTIKFGQNINAAIMEVFSKRFDIHVLRGEGHENPVWGFTSPAQAYELKLLFLC